ncbi:hypothetical protein [Cellulomonas iranensis]|uniref:hypothetical protein n=1 Tax=Cellulomonas iranensis TaxID=76862 RepID=UPI003D7EBACB
MPPTPPPGTSPSGPAPLDRPAPPTRRAPRSRRRALALLVTTALGLVGVVTLLVTWVSIGVRTVQAAQDAAPGTCLAAYEAGEADARVGFGVVPARSVCTWDVDGARERSVVAAAPTAVVVGGLVLLLGGAAGTAVAVLPPRQARAAAGGAAARRGDAP